MVLEFINDLHLWLFPPQWYGGVEKALKLFSPSALCSWALWSCCRHDAFARRVRHEWSSHRSSLGTVLGDLSESLVWPPHWSHHKVGTQVPTFPVQLKPRIALKGILTISTVLMCLVVELSSWCVCQTSSTRVIQSPEFLGHCAWRSFWVFGLASSLVSSQGRHSSSHVSRAAETQDSTERYSHHQHCAHEPCGRVVRYCVCRWVRHQWDSTGVCWKTADLLHVRLAGSRGSVMHTAWAPFSSELTFVGLCFSCCPGSWHVPWLPTCLFSSCVLSVLRGKGPHAALETPPLECIVLIHTVFLTQCPYWIKESSSVLPVLNITLWRMIQDHTQFVLNKDHQLHGWRLQKWWTWSQC